MGRAALLLRLALGAVAATAPLTPAKALELEVSGGLVSLRAFGAPLGEVLQALGEAGGFTVVLRGELATPVWDDFAGRPLERALRRLVGDRSLVIRRAGGAGGGAKAPTEVIVVGSRAETALAAAPTPAVADPGQPAAAHRADRGLVADHPPPRAGPRIPSDVAAPVRPSSPGAIASMRERAQQGDAAAVRIEALEALARSAGEQATPSLGRALVEDHDPEVRLAAIRELGKVGGTAARMRLERATRDPHWRIARAARQALTGLTDAEAAGGVRDQMGWDQGVQG